MSQLHFVKMHGCGNDYIYFDCFEQKVEHPEQLSIQLSRPHFGIGGDGIILIEPSSQADARMRIFNKDGSEGRMCGNGIRCVGKYLYDSGRVRKEVLTVDTLSGIKTLRLKVGQDQVDEVTVEMGKAVLEPEQIPVLLSGPSVVNQVYFLENHPYHITCVSMGNPHCILFCEDVEKIPLEQIGPKFENAPIFPDRVNTEFVQVLDKNHLRVRVWERGSGETMACGTGACACAVAAVQQGICRMDDEIQVELLGGSLKIRYTPEQVYMTGGAETVFTGEVKI